MSNLGTCKACTHFYITLDMGMEGAGECRRYPPNAQYLPAQGGGMMVGTTFPRLKPLLNCGEFAPKVALS